MAFYSTIFFFIVLCTVVSCGRISSGVKNLFYYICAILLVFFSAFRNFTVGADTQNYCQGYVQIRHLTFREAMNFRWEKGYVALNWLLGRFFEHERTLLIVMAIFILFPIFYWVKKESKWPLLSIVVFFGMGMWDTSMFILRQWCAMAVLTYSYKYIKEKDFFSFIIVVLIAMMFHRTAAIFLLAYFIENISIKKSTIIFSAVFSIGIGLLGGRILNFLNHFARISEAGNFNGGFSILATLWLCIIASYICFHDKLPSNLNFSFRLVFLAAFLQPIAFTFSNWSRVISYFSISLVIFLPNFIMEFTSIGTRNTKFRLPLALILSGLMFIWFKRIDMDPYEFMTI